MIEIILSFNDIDTSSKMVAGPFINAARGSRYSSCSWCIRFSDVSGKNFRPGRAAFFFRMVHLQKISGFAVIGVRMLPYDGVFRTDKYFRDGGTQLLNYRIKNFIYDRLGVDPGLRISSASSCCAVQSACYHDGRRAIDLHGV